MNTDFGSKSLTFVAVMAALGNVLSFVSIRMAPILPSVPLGPISVSLALDLSHLSTFIAALFGGPLLGGLTGLIGGSVAAFEFGFSKANIITGIGLPIGKAMTGVTAGFILGRMNLFQGQKLSKVFATAISYIPEGLFTAFVFIKILPVFFPMDPLFLIPFTVQIIVKAFFEMIVMGLILVAIAKNQGFTGYIRGIFT